MNIIIKKNIDLTSALEDYLRKKFATLEKFVISLAGKNPAELTVEVERTTNHHRKGDIYRAAAKLHFSGVVIRAEKDAGDIRVAIDAAKDTLREELEKYKDRNLK